MKGYWNQPDKTAEAIDKDGFMHTGMFINVLEINLLNYNVGDLATFDEQGYCRIVGRSKVYLLVCMRQSSFLAGYDYQRRRKHLP